VESPIAALAERVHPAHPRPYGEARPRRTDSSTRSPAPPHRADPGRGSQNAPAPPRRRTGQRSGRRTGAPALRGPPNGPCPAGTRRHQAQKDIRSPGRAPVWAHTAPAFWN